MKRTIRSFTLMLTVGCASTPTEHHHGHHGGHGDAMHRDFSDAAQWAKRFDDPSRDEWQKPSEVVTKLLLDEAMVVADIGAGTGYFLPHLSKALPKGKVLGLDIEPNLIQWMQDRAQKEGLNNVEAKLIAGDDPGLAEGSVDRIMIVDTWHHIPGRDAYSQKLLRALKPGGKLMIVDFTKDSPEGPPPEFRIPAETVAATLKEAGFTPEVIEESLPRQYIVVGTK